MCRDASKRGEIIAKCRQTFASCHVMDCSEDVNKILVLSRRESKQLAAELIEIGRNVRNNQVKDLSDDAADQIAFLLSTMSTQ